MIILSQYFDEFSPEQMHQFEALGELYRHWNGQVNVISRKDIDSLYERHVLHSLSIVTVFDFFPGLRIMDLGTGGGFPGIPLAIYRPDIEFVLIDSVRKKTIVVQEIVDALGLHNVSVKHMRAEDSPKASFDFVITRAVAKLEKLWQWTRPLIKKGQGSEEYRNGLICLKGGDLGQEISESGLRPLAFDIGQIYREPYYNEKFILYVKR